MTEGAHTLSIAVFSYNRGRNLEVCLKSIAQHIPDARTVVYDDHSTDEKTCRLLERTCFEVKRGNHEARGRHGALYSNMQLALQNSETEYLLLLQDDTQIVRPLSFDDFAVIKSCFEDPSVALLRCQFMKAGDGDRILKSLEPGSTERIYSPKNTGTVPHYGNAYCDVVLCHVPRLRAANWRFADSERANQIAAQRLFKHMPLLGDPFVFYCPEVPSYRDRRLYLASRLVQQSRGGKVVSYRSMTPDEVEELKNRPLSQFPIAEDWLTTDLPDVKRPFVFQDYARTWWLTVLYKVESRLWRMWKPFRRLFRP